MPDLSSYQVDHLLLLVGGNPMPNAVAGKLLAVPNGRITLVHTVETAPVANRLRQWLHVQGFRDVRFKEVEEANPTSIVRGIQEQLKDSLTQRVGLNYTGGTKAMSVHAYRAVEHWAKGKYAAPVFSYLDARQLQMVFDPSDPASGEYARVEYVGRAVELKLDGLLDLHGWRPKHLPNYRPALPAIAKVLALACAREDSFNHWSKWVHGEFRSRCRSTDRSDKWKSKKALCSISLPFPNSGVLGNLVSALRSELGPGADTFTLKQPAFADDPEDFCQWLDGKWLEHHVLDVLDQLAEDLKLHQCAQNIETHEVQFDVDVIALRGYQLFALSCSTDSTKRLLKAKLFEAYIRARQLGGDEARVALVCCFDDPEELEREMRRDVDAEGRIKVFGRRHLADLPAHLNQWIRTQTREG